MVELSTSDRCKKKLQLTFQIQSAITQRARPYRTNSHFSLSLFISLIAHISPGLFERDLFWLCTSELWMGSSAGARGEACLRADVMPACREVARLDESRRRTCSAKLGTRTCLHMRVGMCSFFQQMAALRRLEGEDKSERRGTVCGLSLFSSRLYDFHFLFTPYRSLGPKPCFYVSQDGGLILYVPVL